MERLRRLRATGSIRAMVRENHVRADELIYPLFVREGAGEPVPVPSMPGVFQYAVDGLDGIIDRVAECGVRAVLLFGVPSEKDDVGSGAYDEKGVVPQAIRAIKARRPDMLVIADVCLCEYTSHGHCGLVEDGRILNDETLPLLARSAVC